MSIVRHCLRPGSAWLTALLLLMALVCASMGVAHAAETITYYYTSPQGTVLAKADASGNILSNADYRPYGTQALGTPEQGPGYTGHVNDVVSDLVYMQARYYDPQIGRFLSTDPQQASDGDLYSANRYSYANGNPISNIDPDGRSSCPGQSKFACIQADSYIASRSTGQTAEASPAVRGAMVSSKSVVAVSQGGLKEKIAFVRPDTQGGFVVAIASDATTSSSPTTDAATAVPPTDSVAVLHGHIDGRSDGVVSPADAKPLARGLPNGVVSEGRVGVTEIKGGRLQFQMLEGRMSRHETDSLQKSLDRQQLQPEFMKPEN